MNRKTLVYDIVLIVIPAPDTIGRLYKPTFVKQNVIPRLYTHIYYRNIFTHKHHVNINN